MAYDISTTIEIAATPENVWAVLADLASYPKWHPMYQAVTGHLAAGSTLTITSTHPTSGRTVTAKVKVLTVEPDAELRWVSKLLGRTISERTFQLSSTADGTSLVQAGSSANTWMRQETNPDWLYGYDAWAVPLRSESAAIVSTYWEA